MVTTEENPGERASKVLEQEDEAVIFFRLPLEGTWTGLKTNAKSNKVSLRQGFH